jgi:hypothetical protein
MGFCVVRGYFKNGNESDEIEQTYSRDFDTFDKALKHGERYAKGIRFYDYTICESETMKELYRKNYCGDIEDFRTKSI